MTTADRSPDRNPDHHPTHDADHVRHDGDRPAPRRPNIVFFLADDLGWRDVGCYGSSFYETPVLDKLRATGMLFTDAYAACPVCSPTRASLLTGKYPATVGVTDWIDAEGTTHPTRGAVVDVPYVRHLPDGERTLAHDLSSLGYQTWHVGKWHLGGAPHLPEDVGFDINIGGCHHGSPGPGGYFSPWTIDALADAEVPDGTYLTDYLTDRAVDLIDHRDRTRPFFLNMWYYLVHTPIQAPEHLVEKYRKKAQALGLDRVDALQVGAAFPCEHKRDQRIRRRIVQSDPVYAAMVETLDASIGRVLSKLVDTQAEDTMVVFSSDNGGLATAEGSPTCNAPLSEGKGWMYDGGVREPLIVRWPGHVAPGSTCNVPVTSPDIRPTILDCVDAGSNADAPTVGTVSMDGASFRSLLEPGTADSSTELLSHRAIYWHYPHYGNQGGTPGSVVRQGPWKLLHFFEDDGVELCNLDDDIGETADLSKVHPETTTRLMSLLDRWRSSVCAKVPIRNRDYTPWPDRAPPRHFG